MGTAFGKSSSDGGGDEAKAQSVTPTGDKSDPSRMRVFHSGLVKPDTPLGDLEALATLQLMDAIRVEGLTKSNWLLDHKLKAQDNTAFPYQYKRLELPLDDEGFAQSFAAEDTAGIQRFYRKYGVVVVSGILTKQESERSAAQLWEFMERQHPKLKRNDPQTWDKQWPKLKHLGILGNDVCLSPQFCENRQNPKLHQAFAAVCGTKRLTVNVGRASAMRPTKNVPVGPDGALVDKPEWKTLAGWVHWDMNPWTGETTTFSYECNDHLKNRGYTMDKVQGVLTLVDCRRQDGGFHCVPGFHAHIRGWANANLGKFNPQCKDTTIQVPPDDPMKGDAQPVPARAGSIIIWSSTLPHGSYPNDSDRGRMVQYIKMARVDDDSVGPVFTCPQLLPSEVEATPLGRRLLGFDQWDDDPGERPTNELSQDFVLALLAERGGEGSTRGVAAGGGGGGTAVPRTPA